MLRFLPTVKDKEDKEVDSEARPMKDETFGEYRWVSPLLKSKVPIWSPWKRVNINTKTSNCTRASQYIIMLNQSVYRTMQILNNNRGLSNFKNIAETVDRSLLFVKEWYGLAAGVILRFCFFFWFMGGGLWKQNLPKLTSLIQPVKSLIKASIQWMDDLTGFPELCGWLLC